MTSIRYRYTDKDGNETILTTKPEADKAVEENGGSYELITDYVETSYEGHCRIGARSPGKQAKR